MSVCGKGQESELENNRRWENTGKDSELLHLRVLNPVNTRAPLSCESYCGGGEGEGEGAASKPEGSTCYRCLATSPCGREAPEDEGRRAQGEADQQGDEEGYSWTVIRQREGEKCRKRKSREKKEMKMNEMKGGGKRKQREKE